MCRCNMLATSFTADAVNLTVGATRSVSRYSLVVLKQLIKYTCTILHTEINFNQIESLVGTLLSFIVLIFLLMFRSLQKFRRRHHE